MQSVQVETPVVSTASARRVVLPQNRQSRARQTRCVADALVCQRILLRERSLACDDILRLRSGQAVPRTGTGCDMPQPTSGFVSSFFAPTHCLTPARAVGSHPPSACRTRRRSRASFPRTQGANPMAGPDPPEADCDLPLRLVGFVLEHLSLSHNGLVGSFRQIKGSPHFVRLPIRRQRSLDNTILSRAHTDHSFYLKERR